MVKEYLKGIRSRLESEGKLADTKYIKVGSLTIRLLVYSEEYLPLINAQLSPSMTEKNDDFDYSIYLWRSDVFEDKEPERYIFGKGEPGKVTELMIDYRSGKVAGFDPESRTAYYALRELDAQSAAAEGHLLVKILYRILKAEGETLIHGACVGLDGTGVMICARGNKGKSTLAVKALLEGFEYVSDDYMILSEENGSLQVSPIYSIITLSEEMYGNMEADLKNSTIVSDNWNRTKKVIDISDRMGQFRSGYPVRICLSPEICPCEEPEIVECSQLEKGAAIAQTVHSTISQMRDSTDKSNVIKLMRMFQKQTFYKIRLCRNLEKNVGCLREFLSNFAKS